MLKRTSIVLLLVAALSLAVWPGQSVHGIAITPEELAALNSIDVATKSGEKSKEDSNDFVRALKAPFKALGRLFGGKKKENKLERISEKDVRRFESVPAQAVTDAKTPKKEASKEIVNNVNRAVVVPGESEYSTHFKRGQDLLNAGDLNGAIAELSFAVSVDKKAGEARNLLAIAYEGKGLRARALESFKAAVQADKDNAEYLNNYGFLLFKNNDYDDATKYLKRAAKLSPNDARIWNNLGLVQSQREKFDDALQSFIRAGGEFDGHMNLASQLQARGYAKDAIKHLEKAQTLQPNSVDVLAKLVSLYQMTGRAADAEAARRSLVALRTFADAKK